MGLLGCQQLVNKSLEGSDKEEMPHGSRTSDLSILIAVMSVNRLHVFRIQDSLNPFGSLIQTLP